MKGRRYIAIAVVVIIAVILVGFAMSPGLQKQTPARAGAPQNGPANPGTPPSNGTNGNPSNGGTEGSGANYSAPTWATGDYWTYNVSVEHAGMTTQSWDSPLLLGTVTKTVRDTETTPAGTAYNVTVSASFALNDSFSGMEASSSTVQSANVTGYILYRTSDLARIAEAWEMDLSGSTAWDNTTFAYALVAKTWVSYNPPLAVWKFPLTENATWNASSNVSVVHWSQSVLTYGNHTYEWNHTWNGTFLLDLAMQSGAAANVTVPAGTFGAIPVSIAANHAEDFSDRVANEVWNVTSSTDDEPSGPAVQLWYSGQVGNVVKATARMGPWDSMVLEAELVAYHIG